MKQILALDATNYRRHIIHGENRVWTETNCYTDVIIELLHGLGHEPIAALPFTLAIDFEGDQWTFFKFPDTDLIELYGLDIHELTPWRPLVDHIQEQIACGRPVLVELDSWFLPDTAGTAYKLAHVKSTVAVNEIDIEGRKLGYFHNQGYYSLQDQDFVDIFQLGGLAHERILPPYVEFVKAIPNFRPLTQQELIATSLRLLARQLALAPSSNPFQRFKARFEADMPWLLEANTEMFHAYSFATLRQYGSCFELAHTYLQWLSQHGVTGVDEPAAACIEISQNTKALQFQLARAMARKRPLDLTSIDTMATAWDRAIPTLQSRFC